MYLDGDQLPTGDCVVDRGDGCEQTATHDCPASTYSVYTCQLSYPTIDPTLLGRDNGHGTFAHNLLASLLRFKDGDFSSRMPATLTGLEGKIADVFNEILAVSERRAGETARVCRVVGKEGKLKERMRVPGAVGGWADEVAARACAL